MRTITESYHLIMQNLGEINYRLSKYLRPPSAVETIKQVEKELDIKFNIELIELYSCADGTNNDYNTPSGLLGLIPIHIFMSLHDAVIYYKAHIEFKDSFHNWEKNLAPGLKLFPFLEDGAGNCYWVDLNEKSSAHGKIYWTNSYGEDPDYKYESLTSMFHVISECYSTGVFFIDSEGYLDCDYDQFYMISKKFDNELYWLNK